MASDGSDFIRRVVSDGSGYIRGRVASDGSDFIRRVASDGSGFIRGVWPLMGVAL